MVYALLFLGLLPLALLGGSLPASDTEDDDVPEADAEASEPEAAGAGDLLDYVARDPVDAAEGRDLALTDEAPVADDPGAALLPVTEDDLPQEGEPVARELVLAPNLSDEPPVEGEEVTAADVLQPVQDPGPDLSLNPEPAEAEVVEETGTPVEIDDFRSGTEVLQITLDSGFADDATVSVAPSADGQDGVVSVNGVPVAILKGAPEASTADIRTQIAQSGYL